MKLLLALILPLLSAIVVSLVGRFLGRRGAAIVTISGVTLAALISWFYFLQAARQICRTTMLPVFCWVHSSSTNVEFTLYGDQLTLTMFVVVTTISTVVHWYSFDYLFRDPHLVRFMALLSFFTFFMLVLVCASDLVTLFVGWEGVGLLSYLLINFWYTRIQANKSALKAIFVNRVGDIALLLAIAMIYLTFGTTSFPVLSVLCSFNCWYMVNFIGWSGHVLYLIAAFVLIAAIGKSAQLTLHVWLPDAMEGPTPVSALLHAATMVTAGVFLLLRMNFLIDVLPQFAEIIAIVGAVTSFFAATVGLVQHDLKRIIAFSTCSQLGYMFVSCGTLKYATGLFHLFNHAFFKALLFLAAGSVIHALNDEQDIRRMGYLSTFLPLTFSFFTVASFSLMGLPYLSGYYSKDIIIEYAFITNFALSGQFVFWLVNCAAFFTAMYSFRLLFHVFCAQPNFSRAQKHIHDASFYVQAPLLILALLSIGSGYISMELFSELTINPNASIFLSSSRETALVDVDFLPLLIKQLPFYGSVVFAGIAYTIVQRELLVSRLQGALEKDHLFVILYWLLNNKWFFDKIYNTLLLQALRRMFVVFYVFLDKGILELFGPTGFSKLFNASAAAIVRSQHGSITNYLQIVISLFVLLVVLVPFFIS
jgi:proton-translocating NADH-quinone oxidoreductase chain L